MAERTGRSPTRSVLATTLKRSGELRSRKWTKLKPNETIIFSFVVFKSRTHRDRVNAKVMKEMEKMCGPKDMPFDVKRMVYGGFKALVDA